jgi:2-succinyl-6-hydroxy-2,4-cyclohexadiene-1-carboxylate synthase
VEKIFVIALHGFLGRPSDWNLITDSVEWICPDLFLDATWGAGESLDKAYLCIYNQAKILAEKGQVIILGYSMGGRLALGALSLDREEKVFSKAVLISVHPGLKNDLEKIKRIEADKKWSQKISQIHDETEWNCFLKEWNDQEVFKNSLFFKPQQKRSDYDLPSLLPRLAKAMTDWSLGLQPNFQESIYLLRLPILWVVGECDSKFVTLSNELAVEFESRNKSNFQKIIIKNSGHRVIFDQPQAISELMIASI